MDHIEQAKKNHDRGCSCSQAVVMAYAEELGLKTEEAARVASTFGGGMGRSGGTCGAVTGALMALGLARGDAAPTDKAAKEPLYALSRQMLGEFEAACGSLECRELLGADTSTPEGLALAREQKLFAKCGAYVEEAVRILEKLLERERTAN